MRNRGSRNDGSRATLRDALSAVDRAKLSALRASLESRAQKSVERQLGRPQEPWRVKQAIRSVDGPSKSEARQSPQLRSNGPARSTAKAKNGGMAREAVKHRIAIADARHRLAAARAALKTPAGERPKAGTSVSQKWDLPPNASVREQPPRAIDVTARDRMEELLRAGSAEPAANAGALPLFASVGLDFGTSCTKVVVRFEYEPGSPAIAIPAPEYCLSGGDPYLWQTVVWARRDGTFVAWPEPGATMLHSLKQGLVAGRPNETVAPVDGKSGIIRLDAAAAYLAFVLRYVRGWLATNRPALFRGRLVAWFASVGLPAADYDKRDLLARYRAVCATALMLSASGEAISMESTRAFSVRPEVLAAAGSSVAGEELGIAVMPEVAAEVAGFMRSSAGASGLYLLVDVGAMTLDAGMFRFAQRQGEPDLYARRQATVRSLGVEAYHWYMKAGRSHEGFVRECEYAVREVVSTTRRQFDLGATAWASGNDLPIFLVGGGARNKIHGDVVNSLDPWLRTYVKNDGARVLNLAAPDSLELPVRGGDYARLPVAWGLSLGPSEIGEILPPPEPDIPLKQVRDYTGNFTSKDQV